MRHKSSKGVNLMVIDDSNTDLLLTQNVLSFIPLVAKASYFESAEEALHVILNTNNSELLPDLIILDISMPNIDGFEFIMELEESGQFIDNFPFKIIFLTNSVLIRDREKIELEQDVIGFLQKPVQHKELQDLILEYISIRQEGLAKNMVC